MTAVTAAGGAGLHVAPGAYRVAPEEVKRMLGIEHASGVYLRSPPADGTPAVAIAVLAILAAALVFEWWRDAHAHR